LALDHVRGPFQTIFHEGLRHGAVLGGDGWAAITAHLLVDLAF